MRNWSLWLPRVEGLLDLRGEQAVLGEKGLKALRTLGKITKNSFSRLIPSVYYKDPAIKRSIYRWLLVGLLIRLIFMPLAFHTDLLGIYERSSLIVYEGVFWVAVGQSFVHYLHALFLWILRPLMPYFESILPGRLGSPGWETFTIFVGHTNIFRTLFLLKIPYLIFDLGCAFLLLAIFSESKKGRLAFIFWMLNPVVIFSVFVFSRFESIAIFFILLSLYYAKKNLLVRSLFCLGVAVITRLYPLILLPFFVIILGKGLRQRLKLAFWGLLPLIVMVVLSKLLSGVSEVESWARLWHGNYLMSLRFPPAQKYDVIFVFFVGYTILLLYTHMRTNHSFTSLWRSSLALLLLFFATSFFHPHYFMWVLPFLTFKIVEDRRFIGFFVIQVLCWVVYTFQWKEALAGYLFAPINPSYFMSLRSPFEIINQYYSSPNFIRIFRSIFSGVCLWMIYLIFRKVSLEGKRGQ